MATRTNTTATPRWSNARDIGAHGLQYTQEGDTLIIIMDVSKVAKDRAPMSSTGKSKLLASTGGWVTVPGSDLKLNVMASTPKAG